MTYASTFTHHVFFVHILKCWAGLCTEIAILRICTARNGKFFVRIEAMNIGDVVVDDAVSLHHELMLDLTGIRHPRDPDRPAAYTVPPAQHHHVLHSPLLLVIAIMCCTPNGSKLRA